MVLQRLHGRTPTSGEVAAAVDAFRSGTSRGTWLAFVASGSEAVTALRAEVEVTMAYLGLLGRAPDPGGFAYWVGEVDAGRRTVRTLLAGFLGSAEYRDRVT